MNINRTGMQGLYMPGKLTPAQVEASAPPKSESSKHTDVISISRTGALSQELGRVSRDIASEVDRSDGKRIESLRAEVQGNTYSVPSEKVADAILARALGV